MVDWEGSGYIFFARKLLKPLESPPPNILFSNLQVENGTANTINSDFCHYFGYLSATNF